MDVKSKNILLDKEYNVAKIADVGLARVLGNTVSTRGLPLGTFHYAAPELLVGNRNLVTEKVPNMRLHTLHCQLLRVTQREMKVHDATYCGPLFLRVSS